jgi:hypothetical protein
MHSVDGRYSGYESYELVWRMFKVVTSLNIVILICYSVLVTKVTKVTLILYSE